MEKLGRSLHLPLENKKIMVFFVQELLLSSFSGLSESKTGEKREVSHTCRAHLRRTTTEAKKLSQVM